MSRYILILLCVFAFAKGSDTYGAFKINLISSYFKSEALKYVSDRSRSFNMDLGAGWVLDGRWLVGGFLDGSAGDGSRKELYSLSAGVNLGVKIFGDRIIPQLRFGYASVSLPISTMQSQSNASGPMYEAGLFINIEKGYGINMAYRRSINWAWKSHEDFKARMFLIGFSFYDFNLWW